MSNLSRLIRRKTKSGTSIPAIVVDVFYDKASVRLANNGSLMRNLKVIGGPVTIGDPVDVDFTTPVPTVVVISKAGISLDDVTTLINASQSPSMLGGFSWQLLLFLGGVLSNIYNADATGLTTALVDAGPGSVILVPACEIIGDFTIPESVEIVGISQERSILIGTITGSNWTVIDNLKIEGSITGIASDYIQVKHCHVYNIAGAAIATPSTATIHIHQSIIQGSTYAISNSGITKIFHSGVYGETDWFSGNVSTYCVTEVIPILPPYNYIYRNFWNNNNAFYSPSINSVIMDKLASIPTSPTTTQIFTTTPASSNYPNNIIRLGRYIYYYDRSATNRVRIIEYNLDNATTVTLNVLDIDYTPPVNLNYAGLVNRKILVRWPGSVNGQHVTYLLDFAAETSTSYIAFDESAGSETWYSPNGVLVWENSNNDLMVCVFGVYENTTNKGIYTVTKNYTQSSSQVLNSLICHATRTSTVTLFSNWSLLNNRKAVLPVSIDPFATNGLVMCYVLDIVTETLSKITYELSEDRAITGYSSAPDHDEQVVYCEISGFNQQHLWRIDPYAETIAAHYTAPDSNTIDIYGSRWKAYFYIGVYDALYDCTTKTPVLSITEPSTGFTLSDGTCQHIGDEDLRLWYWDGNGNIVGKSINDDTLVTLVTSITDPGGAGRIVLVQIGDMFVVIKRNP